MSSEKLQVWERIQCKGNARVDEFVIAACVDEFVIAACVDEFVIAACVRENNMQGEYA